MAVTQLFQPQPNLTQNQVVTATKSAVPVARWIGDDWQFEVAYLNVDGTPFDLTNFQAGGNLYNHSDTGIDLGGQFGQATVTQDPTQGLIYAVVFAANTTTAAGITADPTAKAAGGTRLQIYLLDPAGLRTTILVQPIWVRQE